MVSEDRCYTIRRFCEHCLHFEGDFAECGVYKGGTAFLIADTIVKDLTHDRQLHLFDTFTGMPSSANEDPSNLKEGRFGDTSLTLVKQYLEKLPSVIFHHGIIPETFKKIEDCIFRSKSAGVPEQTSHPFQVELGRGVG